MSGHGRIQDTKICVALEGAWTYVRSWYERSQIARVPEDLLEAPNCKVPEDLLELPIARVPEDIPRIF